MAVGTVFLLLVPYILQRALDTLAANDADLVESLIPAGLAIVVVHALHGFFTYLRGRWAAQASEGIVRRLRHRLYEQLEQLPCDYHDHADTGDLVQRCSSDVETVRVFLASQVVEIARVSLFVAVALPIMLTQDLKMTLISTCILPVLVVSAVIFFRKVRREFKEIDEAEGRLTTVIQENLTGIRVVRGFGRQDYENAKFLERNSRFRDLEYKLFHIFARFWSLSDLLVFLQTGLAAHRRGVFRASQRVNTWTMGAVLLVGTNDHLASSAHWPSVGRQQQSDCCDRPHRRSAERNGRKRTRRSRFNSTRADRCEGLVLCLSRWPEGPP